MRLKNYFISSFCVFSAVLFSLPISAEGLKVDLPVTCLVGKSCWLVNYMDTDPSPGVSDFQCNGHSYDGHKGTDFMVRSKADMAKGFPVIASAAGLVSGVRDGMADVGITDGHRPASIKGRECGNGVVIKHGDGWETQYCHLQRGSVQVTSGERVKPGQVLGLIGQSGLAEMPHVHFEIRKDGTPVDPFTGQKPGRVCGQGGSPLWTAKAQDVLRYEPSAIFHLGFADRSPSTQDIDDGRFEGTSLSASAPILIAFGQVFWVNAGDKLHFKIIAPDGTLFVETETDIEKTQARRTIFVGKKLRQGQTSWKKGPYRAIMRLIMKEPQNGRTELEESFTVMVQ